MPRKSFVEAVLPLLVGFVLLATSAGVAIWLSMLQQDAVRWVRHTLEVENTINRVASLVTEAESGQRGFLLTGQQVYLRPYETALARLPEEVERLRRQTADNPRQRASLGRLRGVLQRKLGELGGSVALARLSRNGDAIGLVRTGEGNRQMAAIRAILNEMQNEETRLLAERTDDLGVLTAASRAALALSALLVIALAILAPLDARRRLAALERSHRKLEEEASERRAAQTQVRQLQKMEAVGQLTGGIAHDFNNMLAIVIGSLDIARRRLAAGDQAKVAQYIDNALEGAQRASTLTARLLAFSRQQPLEPKVLDANKLVGGMSEMLRRALGERVQVETVLAGGLWRVCADPAQIESALVNLAVNARDAMADGGKLTVETANCELDERYAAGHDEVVAGQYVMVSVTDTGSGMSREVMERAFDPYYTTKGVGRGTGLGLSQVFGFLKQSRGHVKIYSELGQGTTVKLYLPRHTGSDVSAATNVIAGELPGAVHDEIILVVEDEAAVRHMTVDALRELGYTVVAAVDANQALEQLMLQPRVDLMFTDIMMPGLTGRQLADKAHEARPDLKILYTTGYTRNAVVHNGIVDYGVSFLAKPFSIAGLARKVREVLDS